MKRKFFHIILIIVVIINIITAEDENQVEIKNVQCVDPDTGEEYRVGDIWTASGQCLGKNCGQTKHGNYTIGLIRCPVYTLLPGCFMDVEFLDKQFPECCSQPECDKVY